VYACADVGFTDDKLSYNIHVRPIFSDKCFKCHGPDEKQRKADLRLDLRESVLAPLKSNPSLRAIVPGDPEKSEIYHRIISDDPDYMMPTPESHLELTEAEKSTIKRWIEQGAEYEKHWSFNTIKKPEVPTAGDKWATNEIDHFIAAKHKQLGLEPNDIESDELILRRVHHDITGLPPTLAEQDNYDKAPADTKYEKVVDQLLVSPHYGEKMAVFWMDIARYADSHGYQDDGLRTMWPWRDWVIHAFNKNYAYDKFVKWQLAGDLMPNATKEMILATGFNRNHKITQEGGVIDEEYRVEYVSDRTNTFTKGMLGMTFECAKCHDHKYDPISQKDYFSAFAFFNQVNEKGLVGDISLLSLADPPYITITKEDKESILSFVSKLDTSNVMVMVMKDSANIRPTHILNRGQYDQLGDTVKPSMPKSILAYNRYSLPSNRLGLAQWMLDKKNPLTARVFVNHLWKEFFGRGIVKTTGDFGLQGELPTHPELLDWLSADFMEHGWDIKRLVKQIVMSSTYRQSSSFTKESLATDPENVYLARGPRVRMVAELIKDHILASSDLLHKDIGGPSVKPYQPKGLWEGATSGRGQLKTYIQDHGQLLYRRGLYHFIKRTVPPPSMLIFDASNRDQCEVNRSKTNTPLQALMMLNDPTVLEASKNLAQKYIFAKTSPQDAISSIFRKILCRVPKDKELNKLKDYYTSVRGKMTVPKAKDLLNIGEISTTTEKVEDVAALMQTCQIIYNLEEASTR
jgi:hypothetical protein